jgi:hypothetical protein
MRRIGRRSEDLWSRKMKLFCEPSESGRTVISLKARGIVLEVELSPAMAACIAAELYRSATAGRKLRIELSTVEG